jgi:hypothetical protein
MDKKINFLDRDYILDHLTVKTYPVPDWDKYEIRIYFKGVYLTSVEVDGLELECWRHKDNPDPDSKTYDELDDLVAKNEEVSQKQAKKAWDKKKTDMTGYPICKESKRKEGWD